MGDRASFSVVELASRDLQSVNSAKLINYASIECRDCSVCVSNLLEM